MLNAIKWIKQFAEKKSRQYRACLKETEAQHTAMPRNTVWHRHCHWINNANSSPLDRLNRICLIFSQAVLPNNYAVGIQELGPNFRKILGKILSLV